MCSKVTLFIGDLSIGGAERVAVNLANQLVKNGHQVEVVVVSRRGKLVEQLSSNVQLSELPVSRMRWSVIPLAKHLRRSRPDVVISFMTPTNIMMILSVKMSMLSPKIIVTEHIKRVEGNSDHYHLKLAKHLYKYADNIVGVSHGVSENIEKWAKVDPNTISTIYNPVVDEDIISGEHPIPDEFRSYQEDTRIILGAGRHVPRKRFEILIQSFDLLLEECDNAELFIIGEGKSTPEYRSLCEKLDIEQKVHFPGFVDDPFKYMKGADVLSLSSQREGLPTVLIEAMACGTPVVSTDCPSGPHEILKGGEYGELVPIDDPEAMKEALITTLEDPLPAERLKERARDFSAEKSTKQYEALFISE